MITVPGCVLAVFCILIRHVLNMNTLLLGLMVGDEQKIIEGIPTQFNKYFVPLAWATSLLARARKDGRIKDDHGLKSLVDVRFYADD